MKVYTSAYSIQFSEFTIFITLLVSGLLIFLLYLLLTNHQGYKYFRTDFIFIFVLVTVLRLCFPFEYFFTIIIPIPAIMNPVREALHTHIFNIPVYQWLLIIETVGIIIQTARFVYRIHRLNIVYRMIVKNAKITSVGEYLQDHDHCDIPVYRSDLVPSPMVIGFKKAIFLPETEFDHKELVNILEHELTHLRNKDIYIKSLINLLTIIYWWFPPIYVLQRQIDLFLEIRVDNKVTGNYSEKESLQYAQTLVSVQKKICICPKEQDSAVNCFLIDENVNKLKYRIQYLLTGQFKKKTSPILLILVLVLPLFTNAIVLESYYETPPGEERGMISEEAITDGYIIEHEDGSYTFCYGDNQQAIINDPSSFIEQGIPVMKENKQ